MNKPERPPLALQPGRKRRLWLVLTVVTLTSAAAFAAIFAFPIFAFIKTGFPQQAPVSVSTISARYQDWLPEIRVVGSLKPVRGADLSVEVPGIVDEVNFDSGGDVAQGARILHLRDGDITAKLRTLQAAVDLAQANYNRDKELLPFQLVSQAQFDMDQANLDSAKAQVAEQSAVLEKYTLRAPFAGHLGVRSINAGQYLAPGTSVVTLQALDPIFFDFFVPQQQLSDVKVGQNIAVSVDAYPGTAFAGKVTIIDPKVDAVTRNVAVRATLPNPQRKLLPGMYATAQISTGASQRFITVPQTAIIFNPYGNMVFQVQQGTGKDGKKLLTVKQTVVTTGQTRGDQIAVTSGLKEGDTIVTAGQLKLLNGSTINVDNSIQPADDANPHPLER
ncbi:MAG TPA: efflux RND transporter periplasmic adaptor subunit [Micropepsaceae bacterium]|nr:efflux RND transporter periplasmic adaptor subunit [Micropepsaceae bacterium]